ncbi:hypothetical protein LPN01_07580 [Sphingomonas sp. A2-49]|uniref:hypothetical protein n=1 Tax=Sphingomonas sp. A2-49 TaxID=1391375 RepID=UPI0021D0C3B6|nr:hypothetical protein [Sphingomonas sp. A2-49]MCU6453935.1 hypothetical protein [Sphingomonas sp. A2-49]
MVGWTIIAAASGFNTKTDGLRVPDSDHRCSCASSSLKQQFLIRCGKAYQLSLAMHVIAQKMHDTYAQKTASYMEGWQTRRGGSQWSIAICPPAFHDRRTSCESQEVGRENLNR